MYKAISKQLNLTERQQLQLRHDLEKTSWVYSDSIWKRAIACYGYMIGIHLLVSLPFIAISLALSGVAK